MIEDVAELAPEADDQINEEEEIENDFLEISFHAIAGTQHSQTIRLIGRMKNKDLTILIDKGSTHNFIEQTVVTKFGLPI